MKISVNELVERTKKITKFYWYRAIKWNSVILYKKLREQKVNDLVRGRENPMDVVEHH